MTLPSHYGDFMRQPWILEDLRQRHNYYWLSLSLTSDTYPPAERCKE